MEKRLLKNEDDFKAWIDERKKVTYFDRFDDMPYEESCPKSYPCILLTNEELDERGYEDHYYGFVYKTEFDE
jgi:hypothetical protein